MKIVKDFILRKIAGEPVLIPTGKTSQEFNGMITMTDTACFIWENLEKTDSLEDMVEKVMENYEVDRNTAVRDTVGMVNELLAHGMAVCTKADRSW